MLLILLGLLSGQWVGHHLVSVCVWKGEICLFVWDIQHDFCLFCWGHLEKFCILFVSFHVLLHLCNSYTMLYCNYYMVLICVQVMYMCAIVMKIHILPFCYFCIQHTQCICCIFWCCHDSVYLLYLLFLVHDFLMCRNLGHL